MESEKTEIDQELATVYNLIKKNPKVTLSEISKQSQISDICVAARISSLLVDLKIRTVIRDDGMLLYVVRDDNL